MAYLKVSFLNSLFYTYNKFNFVFIFISASIISDPYSYLFFCSYFFIFLINLIPISSYFSIVIFLSSSVVVFGFIRGFPTFSYFLP